MTRIPDSLISRANKPVPTYFRPAPSSSGGELVARGMADAGNAIVQYSQEMQAMKSRRVSNQALLSVIQTLSEADMAINEAASPDEMVGLTEGALQSVGEIMSGIELPDEDRERLNQTVQLKSLEFESRSRRRSHAFELELSTQTAFESARAIASSGDFELAESQLQPFVGRSISGQQLSSFMRSEKASYGESRAMADIDAGGEPSGEDLALLHPVRRQQILSLYSARAATELSRQNKISFEGEVASISDQLIAGEDYSYAEAESDFKSYVDGLEIDKEKPGQRDLLYRSGVAEIAKRHISRVMSEANIPGSSLSESGLLAAEAELKKLADNARNEVSIQAKNALGQLSVIRDELIRGVDADARDASDNFKLEILEQIDAATSLEDMPDMNELRASMTLSEGGKVYQEGILTARDSYIVKSEVAKKRADFYKQAMKYAALDDSYNRQDWSRAAAHRGDAKKHFESMSASRPTPTPQSVAAGLRANSGGAVDVDEAQVARILSDPASVEAGLMLDYAARTGTILPGFRDYLSHTFKNPSSEGGGSVQAAVGAAEVVYALGGNPSMREQLGPLYKEVQRFRTLRNEYSDPVTAFEILNNAESRDNMTPQEVQAHLAYLEDVDINAVTSEVVDDILSQSYPHTGFWRFLETAWEKLPGIHSASEEMADLRGALAAPIMARLQPRIEREFVREAALRPLDASRDAEGMLRSIVNHAFRDEADYFSYIRDEEKGVRYPFPYLDRRFSEDEEMIQSMRENVLASVAEDALTDPSALIELSRINPSAATIVQKLLGANSKIKQQGASGSAKFYDIQWVEQSGVLSFPDFDEISNLTGVPAADLRAEQDRNPLKSPVIIEVKYDDLVASLAKDLGEYYHFEVIDQTRPQPHAFVSPVAADLGITAERANSDALPPEYRAALQEALRMASYESRAPRYRPAWFDSTTGSESASGAVGGKTSNSILSPALWADPGLRKSDRMKMRKDLEEYLFEKNLVDVKVMGGLE